ncbi:MAG: hypothetical protein LBJ00_04300 [Planctomycetaceae bacterium]|nr:hypothetical protein [Planctomycetaceae bacterium]
MNPAPFSLRELVTMAHGRQKHDWNLFSSLICVCANPWLDEDSRLTPEEIHPFTAAEKKKQKVIPFDKTIWKAVTGSM